MLEKINHKNRSSLVYVVVLNYNGQKHLDYCIPSLLKTEYYNFKLLVVDNASTDNSVAWLKDNHPFVEVIISNENRGWSGGNNLGINYCIDQQADFILLANNDIRVDPRWVSEGVKVAENNPLIGIVGFDIYDRKVHNSKESFDLAIQSKTKLKVSETDNVRGVAMLVKRSVFENIGMIDEKYFAYGEENDFEARAQRAGYQMVNISVPIWHFSEGSWSKRPLLKSYLVIRNTIRFTIKNRSLLKILSTVFFLFNIGCNPFYRIDTNDYVNQRYRPKCPIYNFFLVTICLGWNMVFLPETLWKRRQDAVRIRRTKELLSQKTSTREN